MIIQAFQAECERSEKRVKGRAKRGEEPERRVGAQCAEATPL